MLETPKALSTILSYRPLHESLFPSSSPSGPPHNRNCGFQSLRVTLSTWGPPTPIMNDWGGEYWGAGGGKGFSPSILQQS